MFYGGRLLAHLSLERELSSQPEDFIQLLRINQVSIVVIDSDCKKGKKRISDTKTRIREECEKNGVYCWITDGKEIENYLSPNLISKVYGEITGEGRDIKFGKYDDLETRLKKTYDRKWKDSWSYNSAKPVVARKFIEHITVDDMSSDLKEHLRAIVEKIKRQS
jgi:hypothetical protein